jgi:hypothetical protein
MVARMSILGEWQSPTWKGTPCTSDAWPFSSNMAVFEARRAIGQLVRTFGDGVNPPGLEPSDAHPAVLRYIRAARDLKEIMGIVENDLVAEARAGGVTLEMIGRTLGVGRQAIHNRPRPSDERLEQLKNEAFVSWMARQAAKMPQPPEEVANDLDGAAPLERLAYLVRQGFHTLDEADELLAFDDSESEKATVVLEAACRRIERTLKAVVFDRVMWEAMAGWSHQVGTADRVNFYAPTTYLLHVMRLLLWALLHAPAEGSTDIDHFRVFLVAAQRVYATTLLILERPDVGWSIPEPE